MSDERTDPTAPSRRILVIANETVAGEALNQAIRFRARHGSAEVLVVVPALGARLRRLAPGARGAAEERLALGLFVADEILVATHPEALSAWLAGDLVARARSRFGVPVLHVVVQGDGGSGSGPGPGRPRGRRFVAPVVQPTLSAS
jgi:hypothetical protein